MKNNVKIGLIFGITCLGLAYGCIKWLPLLSSEENARQSVPSGIVETKNEVVNPESATGAPDGRYALLTSLGGLSSLALEFADNLSGKLMVYQGSQVDIPDMPYTCSRASLFLVEKDGESEIEKKIGEIYGCDGGITRTYTLSEILGQSNTNAKKILIRQETPGVIAIDAVEHYP